MFDNFLKTVNYYSPDYGSDDIRFFTLSFLCHSEKRTKRAANVWSKCTLSQRTLMPHSSFYISVLSCSMKMDSVRCCNLT